MDEELKKILFNPTVGKIATIVIGIVIIWLIIKLIERNIFSKIKDSDNRYRAKKFGSFIGFILSVVLITVVYSNKLGGLVRRYKRRCYGYWCFANHTYGNRAMGRWRFI